MDSTFSYSLVHVLSYQEIFTPLVKSQLFEQAYEQHSTLDSDKPKTVQVWIICPFRVYWDKKFKSYLKSLRNQFPGLPIRVIGGIDRIKKLPQAHLIYYYRRKFSVRPVIFHFRGDDLIPDFTWLKGFFPKDHHLVDVRGLWPAEYLLEKGIEIKSISELRTFPEGKILAERLKHNLSLSTALTCVSPNLENILKTEFDYSSKSWVVPCAVKIGKEAILENQQEDSWTVGYLGGVAAYQNLDDLVLPFLDCLLRAEPKIKLKLITHQPEQMKALVSIYNWDSKDFEILSVTQSEVASHLSEMDLGLMIRKINLVNLVAQPVKIGEYLAAGVLVVLQKGLGGVAHSIESQLLQVDIEKFEIQTEVGKVIDFLKNSTRAGRRKKALELANEFSWKKNAKIHRENYLELIKN